jgi:RsiW-degrading membrane proteinase PrsW (M82 family)
MFSEAISRHTDEEIEEYFTVGITKTTPMLAEISTAWPKPWVFIRAFVGTLTLYGIFVLAWNEFQNGNLIPGLIMVGSVAIPLSLLIFFFEVNVPRNISLYQIIKLVLMGGIVSIFVSLIGFKLTNLDSWLGATSAGIIEETGKALALLLVVTRPRFRWTLNGLLLGAAVGTGFAVFESAGYALNTGLNSTAEAMFQVIRERGFLSIFGGHVLWTGLVGAALWRVRGNQPFRSEMFFDPRFLRVFGICVLMHMLWNANFLDSLPFYAKYLVLGVVAWTLILGMIQSGLHQVKEAQGTT